MSRFSPKAKSSGRGVAAETVVAAYLKSWTEYDSGREANRLTDSKAAGRIIKAAPADFDFYGCGEFGLIEVKETEHEYRLARAKISQLPRLRLRASAGGRGIVLIHHTTLAQWRSIFATDLMQFGDKGSWNLEDYPLHASAGSALESMLPGVFHL